MTASTRDRLTVASVRKFLAAVVGVVAQAVAAGTLPDSWKPWAAIVLAVATAAGVFGIRNVDPPPRPQPGIVLPNESGFVQ